MSVVPLNSSDEKNISCSIHSFLLSFHVAQLLRKCGIAKIKAQSVFLWDSDLHPNTAVD